MRHRYIDITGQRFGRLVALEFVGLNDAGNAKWKFKCDCGNEPIIPSSMVRLKSKPVKSCGCLAREKARERLLGKSPSNTMSLGEANFNVLFATYQKEANRKHHIFELSKEEFKILTKGDCHYCGGHPSSVYSKPTYNGDYIYNGVDRVDNSKGYVLENCVPCCKRCNQSKSSMTVEEFLSWIKSVYDYSIKELL